MTEPTITLIGLKGCNYEGRSVRGMQFDAPEQQARVLIGLGKAVATDDPDLEEKLHRTFGDELPAGILPATAKTKTPSAPSAKAPTANDTLPGGPPSGGL